MRKLVLLAVVGLSFAATGNAFGQFGQQDDYWWGHPVARSGNVTHYSNGGSAVHSGIVPYYTNHGYAVPGRQTVYSNGFTVTRIGNRAYYHMSNYPPNYNGGSRYSSGYFNRRRW